MNKGENKMKNLLLTIMLSLSAFSFSYSQSFEKFEKFFNDVTMRIDYNHVGNSSEEIISIDQVFKYGSWAGSRVNLIDNFNNGRYYLKIYDAGSGELIFSKGFDSYFGEYQTSQAAIDGIKRVYHESSIIPYPKNPIIFAIERRVKTNQLFEIFRKEINPEDISIIREEMKMRSVKVYSADTNGDSHERVDIAIIGEGYSLDDRLKFEKDLNYFSKVFFSYEPYVKYENKFNIHGIYIPSEESGTDEPPSDIYKNTALNSTFNSLGSERYLLTEDNKAVRDIASHVPYDAIYIMVNHKRYGGGGIYNTFCAFTSDNQFRDYLFIHEFGHSFSGLADEYYTSESVYNDFYPPGTEPLEPNITALFGSDKVKWNEFLNPGIEVPTPWEKAVYDSIDNKWQKERRELNTKIAELKRKNSAPAAIESAESEYALKDKLHSEKTNKYLNTSKFSGMVGVFEGAGYSSQGLYRPMVDCIMFSKATKTFCKVCEAHIVKVIEHYTE